MLVTTLALEALTAALCDLLDETPSDVRAAMERQRHLAMMGWDWGSEERSDRCGVVGTHVGHELKAPLSHGCILRLRA